MNAAKFVKLCFSKAGFITAIAIGLMNFSAPNANAAPAITSISPNYGPIAGGTVITMQGTDLDLVTRVYIDSDCTINTKTSTTLTCTTQYHLKNI